MLYVLSQKGIREFITDSAGILAELDRRCRKRRIKLVSIDALQEVRTFPHTGKACVVLFGRDSKWIFRMAEDAARMNIPVIVAGCHFITSYQCLFSSVSYDWSSAMTGVFAYLDRYKKCNAAVYGISPLIEEQVAAANAVVKFMPWLRCNGEQVFPLYTNLNDCWHRFKTELDSFDAVICPNDFVAVSLIQHIKKFRPVILKDMFIVSLSGRLLGRAVTPSVTSFKQKDGEFAEAILKVHNILCSGSLTGTVHISIGRELIAGASTSNAAPIQLLTPFSYNEMVYESIISLGQPVFQVAPDSEYEAAYKLNKLFSECNAYEAELLEALLEYDNYNSMANALGTAPETVKYYIRKLFIKAGVRNKSALTELLTSYITVRDIKKLQALISTD